MTKYENIITRCVKNGDTILLEVKAVYDGDNLTPSKITMYAIDQKGNVVVDAEIKNGIIGGVRVLKGIKTVKLKALLEI